MTYIFVSAAVMALAVLILAVSQRQVPEKEEPPEVKEIKDPFAWKRNVESDWHD